MSNNLLAGKRGIIFGALDENSIAWKVALKAHEQGAKFTLTNAPVALRLGEINKLAEQCGAVVIPADATSVEELEKLIAQSVEQLGGKTIDISAVSFHKVLQTCVKLDAINEWGSVLTLSYIAGQKAFPGYGDMADAKAMLESIVRSFGLYYGNSHKVRINAVSQSPTKTTAGTGIKGFGSFFEFAEKMSPLGNAPAEDCANYCISLFSDYTRYVTMQTLFHDGGFSSIGVSEAIMQVFDTEEQK